MNGVDVNHSTPVTRSAVMPGIMQKLMPGLWLSLLLTLAGSAASVSSSDTGSDADSAAASPNLTHEFRFVRMMYPNYQSNGWRRNSWLTDAPEAETHFTGGVTRLTRVDTNPDSRTVDVLDDAVFDYPFLYAVEPGHWYLSDERAARLREYLLRGGTLMVDDFHGTQEWAIFQESLGRVFPDRPVVDLPDDHAVFHVLYEVSHKVQIPNLMNAIRGISYERDGYDPHWRGVLDDDGRVMVIINFNMDLGDAWEHADNPLYPEPLTFLAYQTGINYLLYAMTH